MLAAPREPKWLEEAARIGALLCATAVRHSDRCSWVGRSVHELDASGTTTTPTVAALGPDLYDGTAGIALFLSRLHAVTGEQETKTIALEAISHALDESKRSTSRLGMYVGRPGIAFAAAQVAALLDEPTLAKRALTLLDEDEKAPIDNVACDLISGLAGAIMARLSWPHERLRQRDLDVCKRLGDALVGAAMQSGETWSWSAARAMGEGPGTAASHPLTGLSHGAAGIGLVLLALAAKTKTARFEEIGRGAFAYEARAFDEAQGNWPDFRINPFSPNGRSFTFGWCHGAPGIALSRLAALALDENPIWRREWEVGLRSSTQLARVERDTVDDVTLCHGIAGLVEPLFEASRLGTRPSQRKMREVLTRIWTPLCNRFAKTNTWPSGAPSHGPNPALMIGAAGVGWSMLRMHDSTTPSVLLPFLAPSGH